MMQSSWSESRIRAMLAENDFSYQNVELPFGLKTGGKDRSPTARAIFPDDMTGKSVLDIGCMSGFFCFEAEKRGATRVVGVEIDRERLRSSALLGDCIGSRTEFLLLDVEKAALPGTFDYVLCLNVLHHLRNPLMVLEKLIAATREKLVLEIASFSGRDRRKSRLSVVSGAYLERLPVLYANRPARLGKGSQQTFFITRGAIENILLHHRSMFARVDVIDSEHKGRFIAIAHKRRIGRIAVVAGPTSSGKSTTIAKLMKGDLPDLASLLDIGDVKAWRAITLSDLRRSPESSFPFMILHYDITWHKFGGPLARSDDELLEILQAAEQLSFVTVWCPDERLRRQFQEAEIKPKMKLGWFTGSSKNRQLLKDYQQPHLIRSFYDDWFDFTRKFPVPHHVVSVETGMKPIALERWGKSAAGEASAPERSRLWPNQKLRIGMRVPHVAETKASPARHALAEPDGPQPPRAPMPGGRQPGDPHWRSCPQHMAGSPSSTLRAETGETASRRKIAGQRA